MDSEKLFSCAQVLRRGLQACELVPVLNEAVNGQGTAEHVAEASTAYLEFASGLSAAEQAVATSAGLNVLQSPSYWFDMEAGSVEEQRARRLVCLKTIAQGLVFLERLSALVEAQADPLDLHDDAADIKIRLLDAADRASDPDRISRLIDGVDLIYRACARLAHRADDGLKVMRIGGMRGRTVVFSGDVEPATATRRIIRAANDIATLSIQGERYSADEVADSNPFMHALDELYRIGALNADDAEDIRQGVLTGTIMVLECGARLYGVDADGDPLEDPDQQTGSAVDTDEPDAPGLAVSAGQENA